MTIFNNKYSSFYIEKYLNLSSYIYVYRIYIMMKILITAAMPSELKSIKEWIKSANIKSSINVDYLCTWVWNYETIFSLENYLSRLEEKIFVLNIWICWYWNYSDERKHDIIQVSNIINMYSKKEIIVPPYLQLEHMKTCISSEEVIYERIENLEFLKNNELYFDMESWWIWLTCSKHKLPFIILKQPFDFIGDETKSLFNDKWVLYKDKINEKCECLKNIDYPRYLREILNREKQP